METSSLYITVIWAFSSMGRGIRMGGFMILHVSSSVPHELQKTENKGGDDG